MSKALYSGLLLTALLGPVAMGHVSFGQSNQDPPKPTTGDKRPSTEKFPFPGQTSTSTPSADAPQPSDPPSAPASRGASPGGADKQFPFPGEAGTPQSNTTPGASSSSSSSADTDTNPADPAGASASEPELKDKGSEGPQTQPSGRHLLHRVNPPGTKLQSPEERAAEDLDVAHFYMDSGDFKAAYLRGQDAVKQQPDDPAAHFVLAEVALKLNKTDEAITHYEACLKLDPTDKQAKAARKALTRLQAQH